jgi:uncharacterized membrane protein (GlpM family)
MKQKYRIIKLVKLSKKFVTLGLNEVSKVRRVKNLKTTLKTKCDALVCAMLFLLKTYQIKYNFLAI